MSKEQIKNNYNNLNSNDMKTKSVMIIAMMVFFSTTIFAQGPHGKQKMQGQNACMNIPDLSDDQKEKIQDLRTAHMKEVMPLKNKLNEKRAHLKTISTGDNADINKIYAAIDEMSKIRTDIQKKGAKHRQDIRKVLTEDQRVFFDMRAGPKHKKHQNMKGAGCRGNFNK